MAMNLVSGRNQCMGGRSCCALGVQRQKMTG